MKKNIKEFKKEFKKYTKNNVLFLSFVTMSVLNAALLRFLTVKNYFDFNPILADLAFVLIIGSFGYFLKPKNQYKYFMGFSIFFTLLCIINSVYYTNYVSFVSVSLLGTFSQALPVTDAIKEIMQLKDFSYLWQIFGMIMVNYHLKKKNHFDRVFRIENGKVLAINTIIVALILIGFFVSMLTSVDISRLGKQWNREYVVMRFGIYTYQVNDLISSIKTQTISMFGYDEKAKEFREYYENTPKTHTENKYTNVFKGKNLLVIHAESIQNFVLNTSFNDVPVAPFLKKMSQEGLYFSNFYAEESVGTSSDTEFTLNTSLMPASNGTVNVSYWNRDYVSIPKLLRDKGYYAFSMHGNKGSMWNRDNMHKSLGYQKFYSEKSFKIDEKIGLGLSDKSFFRQAVPKLKKIDSKHDNWYGTFIMLTNHTPWDDVSKFNYAVDYKYKKQNETTGEEEEVSAPYMEGKTLGNYFKSVNYADQALEQFIGDLDKEGLLDNTVVVIYGDHDNKIKKSEYNRYYNYDPYTDTVKTSEDDGYVDVDYYFYQLNRKVPFIIWTKDHKYKKEVKEAMGMIDVLPTLGNMFGFSSDYALGNDIFSTSNNVVPFPSGNWLTNKMYYNASTGEGKLINPDETVSVDEIKKNSQYTEKLINISNSIIVYDLIKKTNESKKIMNEYSNK